MIVFISGKISGDENYREKFNRAERNLAALGYNILSPAILPGWLEWPEAMGITCEMVRTANAICMLPDWRGSKGAATEKALAEELGKNVLYYTDLVSEDEI